MECNSQSVYINWLLYCLTHLRWLMKVVSATNNEKTFTKWFNLSFTLRFLKFLLKIFYLIYRLLNAEYTANQDSILNQGMLEISKRILILKSHWATSFQTKLYQHNNSAYTCWQQVYVRCNKHFVITATACLRYATTITFDWLEYKPH